MRRVPATLGHFRAIQAQPAQAAELAAASAEHCGVLIAEGAQAVIDDDGVYFIGGAVDMGFGRGDCWSVVAGNCRHMRFAVVHRMVRKFMDEKARQYRRLELRADLRCPNADRWALLLGFEFECVLRRYYENADAHLFARIQRCPG